MAEIEDVTGVSPVALEHIDDLGLDHGPRGAEDTGVEVALEHDLVAQPVPCRVERNPPVDTQNRGLRLDHEMKELAGVDPEEDRRHPVRPELVEYVAGPGNNEPFVLPRRQRTGPGVEELDRAGAGPDLRHQRRQRDLAQTLHQQ